MGRIGDWINRQRHNRGYGVQSPSAFFFVTQVLKERHPYYAYAILDEVARENSRYARELFRITNYLQPGNCISVGSPLAACSMFLARPGIAHYAISPTGITPEQETLLKKGGCRISYEAEQLSAVIAKEGCIGMLFINATDTSDAIIKAALPYIGKSSVIVVDGIRRSKAIRKWWQQIVSDNATVITYDMYSYGLLFFDKERIKQHYTLKR